MFSWHLLRLVALAVVTLPAVETTGRETQPQCLVILPRSSELASLPRGLEPPKPGQPSAQGGLAIVLNPGPTLQGNPQALGAWQLAAGQLEGLITDPVTVTIDADLAPLPSGVLGSTGSTFFIGAFDTVRNAMVGDAGSDELDFLDLLPTLSQFSAQVPPGYSVAPDFLMTSANCRALGLGCNPSSDASIIFSTNFPFDFDPSDGISPGQYDFVSIATHEMIHALGFVSAVDSVDCNLDPACCNPQCGPPFAVAPTPIDLLRLSPAVGGTNFTNGTRLLAPGNFTPPHACFDGAVDLRFSEGAFNGDGRQASHWRDDQLQPLFHFGIMDPNIAAGTTGAIEANDIRALDLMGWDLVSSASPDCNQNGLPDAQDIAVGGSEDADGDGVPDECQPPGPALENGWVNPPSGTDVTLFTFEVTYTDPTGQGPVMRRVEISPDGGGSWTFYGMDHVEGSFETGALYRHVMQLPEGSYTHRFHFLAADQTTHLYWPDESGAAGPTVEALGGLDVQFCAADPFGSPPDCNPDVNLFEIGDVPGFYWDVFLPNGEPCCDCQLQLYITPPNPYVTPVSVSCGHWEYGTPAVPASNWEFGCDCYTFLAVATHPQYASGQAVLEFHTCPPCPPPCPAVVVEDLAVSPPTFVPECGDTRIDYCINVDARVSIWIKNSDGQAVRDIVAPIAPDHNRAAGCRTDWWDGLDDQGQPVSPGEYTVEIEAIHLDQSSHDMVRFAQTGPGEGEVGEIRGLAYDTDFVYVLTRAWEQNKIVRYDWNAAQPEYVPPEFLLPEYTPPNPDAGEMSPYIHGMDIDAQERLYIRDDQPLPRITIWGLGSWPPTWTCQVGYGEIREPDHSEFAPTAYDHLSDKILTWARDLSVPDDRIYAFPATCGTFDCTIDPTPDQNQPLWASGLAVDADGSIWLSRTGGTDAFEPPCGSVFRTCSAINNARISFRYGRLLYSVEGGLIQVHDLRCNTLQNINIDNSGFIFDTERFITTPEGRYIYAVGRPPGAGGDIRCVRIDDCNSAALRTEPVSVVRGAVSVTEPSGDECWLTDTTECISWATCGTVENVMIRLYDDAGEVPGVPPLPECVTNNGMYCWEIPPTLSPGLSYRIRVEDCDDPSGIYDESDEFSILKLGDRDADGEVNLLDFAAFVSCVTGPVGGPLAPCCEVFDFDADEDADLLDYGGLQDVFGAAP